MLGFKIDAGSDDDGLINSKVMCTYIFCRDFKHSNSEMYLKNYFLPETYFTLVRWPNK